MTDLEAVRIIEAAHARIVEQLEEIALLKGAMAAQDEREQKAGERCGVPYEQHGCDWPDWMAEKVLSQAARIAQLEALGPLVEEYAAAQRSVGELVQRQKYEEAVKYRDKYEAAKARIDAILKGGA